MAPLKQKIVETLENITLKSVLSSLVADLYLVHLLTHDLRDSYILTSLRTKSKEALLKTTAQRLQFLPGLLNDQVRDKLIKEFFARTDWDKWPESRLDILKILLNETVTSLNLGSSRLPSQALVIIAEKCPYLTSLDIVVDEPDIARDSELRFGLKVKVGSAKVGTSTFYRADGEPSKKRLKITKKEVKNLISEPTSLFGSLPTFQHLREVSILHGATNDLLTTLGQNSPCLQKLSLCYSVSVTDQGVKGLCLKRPENHGHRTGCQLHELRVRSFHLNPCCTSLREIDTVGTCVSHFGVAFLLKHLPHLNSLGDCASISEALEVLVQPENCTLPNIRRHATRYKLSRMKEERVTSNKFLLLSSLCPDLRELTLGHSFREVDLGLALESLWQRNGLRSQMGRLEHLKRLSLLNVGSLSVRESIRAVGHQLTHLHVFCKGLDLPTVLESCPHLTSLTLEGPYVSAPYEALESVRARALRKLETVKIRATLPSYYIDLILCSSKRLTKIDIFNIGDIGDSKIEALINDGHFNHLNVLLVTKAPYLTIRAASTLIHKCPKLAHLQDLGGWNITSDQFYKLQLEIEKGNYDISLTYGLSRDTDSDASSIASDYNSDLFDAFRNIFPIVIL